MIPNFKRRSGDAMWKKASVVIQCTLLVGAFLGFLLIQERRLATVEAGMEQQVKGYNIGFSHINKRLDIVVKESREQFNYMRSRIDKLIESRQ